MRFLIVALVLVWSPSSGRAEARLDLHAGGGLEGGMITGLARPDAIAEAGIGAHVLLPGRSWGLGVALETVGRLTERMPIAEELKLDVMLRMRSRGKRLMHGSVGMGLRWMTIEAGEERPSSRLSGIDLFRLGWDLRVVGWEAGAQEVGLDFLFSWTFGCYRGDIYQQRFGDMAYPKREVGCADMLTTTYVLGLQTSLTWR